MTARYSRTVASTRSIASSLSTPVCAEAIAEARDLRAALALGQLAVVRDVGDEQARGVRADVDDGDSHTSRLRPGCTA